MLFTALFIRAPNWKLPKFPQIAEWRGELSFVYIIRTLQGNGKEPPSTQNVDEFYKGSVEGKEPDMTEYVACDSIYIKFKNSKTNRCCWRVLDFGG